MAHWSENTQRLECEAQAVYTTSQIQNKAKEANVHLLWFPANRSNDDALASQQAFANIARYCGELPEASTVCVLTTPPDAALLIPYLESVLKFQLWIAVKTVPEAYPNPHDTLPRRHATLLAMTRYSGSLRHTKTRTGYTYCPACGKTTKDYGGKKHTYHEYGTLISDVWRDIECNPSNDIEVVISRLADLFGVEPYQALRILDMRSCADLMPKPARFERESCLPIEWETKGTPIGSQLLNMDCLEALHALPDNSIDFCFTDPPYNLQKSYDKWDDGLESVKYFAWCDQWLSEMHRVLKPGCTLAVLNIPLWAVRHYQHLSSIMNYQAWIAWDGLSFPVRMIMPAHYAIVCFSKGEARPLPGLSGSDRDMKEAQFLKPQEEAYCLRAACVSNRQQQEFSDRAELNDLWSDVHRLKHNSRRVNHPCQLPPLLMRRLFALFTHPDETILDCFNGAGTSTLIAEQMKRHFIGIELSSQYHALTQERHELLSHGGDPFGKMDNVPKAKNSRVQRVIKQKYEVSKKDLQLDVRRIAGELGHLPTREEVQLCSSYPIQYFDTYFVSWGEVCAAARTTGMSELPQQKDILRPQLALSLE